MAIAGELFTDLKSTVNTYGQAVRFRYFVGSIGAGSYDDDISLFKEGNDTWVSGLVQPIGKAENDLVQQGLLKTDDLKVYFDSSVNVSGTWRLGIGGSPPAQEYGLTEDNLRNSPLINGSVIYHKVFVRKLTTGSLVGE